MSKAELIKQILKIELEMFREVPSGGGSRCQEHPQAFLLVRGATFETWSEDTLRCYLRDLEEARAADRNLFTEKYARLDDLLPALSSSPLIEEILAIEVQWEKELREKYPHLLAEHSLDHFREYLRSELETYSDTTLLSYYTDLVEAVNRKESLAEKALATVFRKLGYCSLEHAERCMAESGAPGHSSCSG
ncbi:MAG: DUF4125 family protein [Firmicutes bacterium]|nr:DUF4125 family protein [Bacillota bacterium]